MAAVDDILAFSMGRELWQQDLLRRIYTQPDLKPQDLDEVLAMLFAHAGVTDGTTKIPEPLAAVHVPHRPVEAPPVVLVSIGDVANTNQLAPGQTLPFATDGITLAYGENGTGKSGYGRLLKGACRVRREKQERVLGNVYGSATSPAEATIRFVAGTDPRQEHRWRDGEPAPLALSRISVFDAATAPLYADKQNEIEYLPRGLDVLPRLAKACEELTLRLQAEVRPVEQRLTAVLPSVPSNTKAAALLASLTPAAPLKKLPSDEHIHALASWTEAKAGKLNAINTALATDPTVAAARCRRAQVALERVSAQATTADALLRNAAVQDLAVELTAARAARTAATLAADISFKAEPLGSGIGSQPWRLMFEHARQFYAFIHPGEAFPGDEPGQHCPYCQQPLDAEAHERLHRFHAFIENATGQDAKRREAIVAERRRALEQLAVPAGSEVRTWLAELAADNAENLALVERLACAFDALSVQRRAILAVMSSAAGEEFLAALPTIEAVPLKALTEAVADICTQAEAYEVAASDPARRATLQAQYDELTGQRTLADNLTAILARRNDLVLLHHLKTCLSLCDTRAISLKNSEMRETYITGDFSDRLKAELAALGLDYLPVKIDGKTSKGKSFVGPMLESCVAARASTVLSDGEFRGLALACFFAEIGGIDGHDGIIIDDPVCSLDHRHTRQVAQRLVTEAVKGRQVIVFTHELTFYYELWFAATEMRVPVTPNWIKHTAEHGFGTILAGDSPWQAKNVKQRLSVVEGKLTNILKIDDRRGETYLDAVTDFYTDLRETWERLVEEKLLNGVVGRFQPGVSTQSLRSVMVTDEDHRTIHVAMTRASEHSGHDRARGRLSAPPSPHEMQKDIEAIRRYMTDLDKRNKTTATERREHEAPPTATVLV
jgi:hypothetical protein